ncbi:ABC transporter ATP-binding protein [Leptospira yasudae]|uniref:ABC transporter ATP-binding protein n=1 Tax=Leptospira yasudae TaxID=2202201 RepID=A0A5F2EA90_9LEPT|nr:ABC transporter ATP-binding protein [Leptospira yasudae]MBW0433602.1 ABC transporter ATP-binding protein [Leptospira yasudae]RHX81944.1 ABC transporter ATP-binding protein [Leptospira yasudae]TGL74469.1 ABC transporter ATP-binding protein [Leptospira yasudae]TGL80597.1 ABC transporter ATP-binding protein [Leptospira yasudae]TGL84293.1 ABC transporter ATP-binding protein [Leptospira yasudae]
MSEFAIEIDSIRKKYKEQNALRGVSFRVPQGSVFGLLGPNGAGKTSLVRILMGFSKQTEGSFRLFGLPFSPLLRKRIGYLPEKVSIPGFLTGEEFLTFSAKLAGIKNASIREKSKSLLEKTGIADAADKKVSGYSKGMLQRLGLASALIGDPELLILDEPGSGLDPKGYIDFRETLVEENKNKGTTVLLNSHRLLEVEKVCHEIGILNLGTLAALGPLESLKEGKNRILLKVESVTPELDSYIRKISSEQKVTENQIEFLPQNGIDLKRIPAELVDLGANILKYERTVESLEEVFLRVTGGNDE